MDKNEINNILENEKTALRGELLQLKNSQFWYFNLSIAATGTLLGLTKAVDKNLLWIYLTPLVVIIPCWWIFFYKAATTTRIVGYYRVLEDMALNNTSGYTYIGWENALSKFRMVEQEEKKSELGFCSLEFWKKLCESLFSRTSNPFWTINWITFTILSLLCLVLCLVLGIPQIKTLTDCFFIVAAFIIVLFSIFHTGSDVVKLVSGSSSHDENERRWRKILSVEQTAPKPSLTMDK